jgi:hypothetical protein
MPRVIPKREKEFESYVDDQRWQKARERVAEIKDKLPSQVTTDEVARYLARSEEAQRIRRELDEEREQRDRKPPVYGPGSNNSYFRDLISVAPAEKNLTDAIEGGAYLPHALASGDTTGFDGLPPDPASGTLADAKRRLESTAAERERELRTWRAGLETRDVTSGDPGFQAFAPVDSTPVFLAEAFAAAAAAQGRLLDALRVEGCPRAARRSRCRTW